MRRGQSPSTPNMRAGGPNSSKSHPHPKKAIGLTADTVSAILILHATTANLLLQKPETVTLCSTSDILLSRLRRPMS